jgi:hypothetical protein
MYMMNAGGQGGGCIFVAAGSVICLRGNMQPLAGTVQAVFLAIRNKVIIF